MSALLLPSLLFIAAANISIRTDLWYPVNGEPGSEQEGYMIDMARAMLGPHGYQIDYKLMPWERSLHLVRNGQADCVVGAAKTEARQFLFTQQAWGQASTTFYVLVSSDWQYQGLVSLKGKTLALIFGYTYGEKLDAYFNRESIPSHVYYASAANALELNVKKLLSGRVDILVETDFVMQAKLKELGVKHKIKAVGDVPPSIGIYIACSPHRKTSAQLMEIFDNQLPQLRKSGELARILEKYGLKDWR